MERCESQLNAVVDDPRLSGMLFQRLALDRRGRMDQIFTRVTFAVPEPEPIEEAEGEVVEPTEALEPAAGFSPIEALEPGEPPGKGESGEQTEPAEQAAPPDEERPSEDKDSGNGTGPP